DATFMSSSLEENPMDSGYPNAAMLPGWNQCYRRRIFAGSLSTHTACSSEHRARVGPFTAHVIRQRGQRFSHAIPTPAAKCGVRMRATLAIQRTEIFTATLVSICPWNIWDRLRAERENFRA